jgi:hypothetical protein
MVWNSGKKSGKRISLGEVFGNTLTHFAVVDFGLVSGFHIWNSLSGWCKL